MATYCNVTKAEMDDFLLPQGFRSISLPNTVELVYGKRADQGGIPLTLRVYTGILPGGESRQVGEDAMRVVLFMKAPDSRIVKLGGSKRVHRVNGWRNNLQNRLDSWLDYLPKDKCECGMPMVPRKGQFGTFLGCTGYPTCQKTRKVLKNAS
jgi:hypothetical protein